MAKNWWFKFDYKVWRSDADLRRCSLETRSFWLEVLCVMYEKDVYQISGTYDELGWLIGCSPEIVARCVIELHRTKAATVTLGNGNVTLLSRRLKEVAKVKKQTRLRVRRHRGNGNVTLPVTDRVISKSKSKEIDSNLNEPSIHTLSEKKEPRTEEKPSLAVAPKRNTHPASHPAVIAVKVHLPTGPDPATYPSIIKALGPKPDLGKLADCYREWRLRGFKAENLAWALEWYVNGIPENTRGNSYGKTQQPIKSNIAAIEQSADYFESKYGPS